MVLSESDAALFYKLFLPLLDFTNKKFKVNDLKNIAKAESLDPEKVWEVAQAVWDHTSCIDGYVKKHGGSLNEDEKEILLSWKKCIKGRFILERHLKKGSIFIGEHNDVYLVNGIITSFEEMFWFQKPPIMMDITIIPFRDVLITDGVNVPLNVIFGSGAKKTFKETYNQAKKAGEIITSL